MTRPALWAFVAPQWSRESHGCRPVPCGSRTRGCWPQSRPRETGQSGPAAASTRAAGRGPGARSGRAGSRLTRPGLRRAASRRRGLPAPASRSESGRRSYIWSHEGRSSSDSLSFPANVLQQGKSSRNSLGERATLQGP